MTEGFVEGIFIAPAAGQPMKEMEAVEAAADWGLVGDRYCEDRGYWRATDGCQVTLIESEDLDAIQRKTTIQLRNGEHRRNLVIRNVRLKQLARRRFKVGEAVLEYDKPRPPCGYIESLTEPGMTKALAGRGGICARVVRAGLIRTYDTVVVL